MAVLELLRSVAQPVGVGEIAQQVGLHQNTVRSHLDLLVDSGYAIRRSEAPSGPGRPRVVYEATAAPEGERNFGLLAEVLAHHLATNSEHPGEAAIVAGRNWAGSAGRWSHRNDVGGTTAAAPLSEEAALAEAMRLLGDIGFAPEMSADGSSVYLHRCPFRELAASQPAVVCGTHLGILQGALAEMGAPFNATRLLPFVEPNLCIATLSRPPARRGRARRNRPPLPA
jgi:predicted ArsR family transcriptional regulator